MPLLLLSQELTHKQQAAGVGQSRAHPLQGREPSNIVPIVMTYSKPLTLMPLSMHLGDRVYFVVLCQQFDIQ